MKLSLKKKKATAKKEPQNSTPISEGWLKDKDHDPDYTERFTSRLYCPENDAAVFYDDLTVKPSRQVQDCCRHIRPVRSCVRKDFLTFTVPFEGREVPNLDKTFNPVFKAIKELEKKFKLKFVGVVHADEDLPTLKNPPPPVEVEEEEEEEVKPKKLKLSLRKKK